jgi:hypothetical protein
MRQFAKRLQRLESTGTFVDFHWSLNRLVQEAAIEVALPPACRQQLAAAIDARLHEVSQRLPAFVTTEPQIDALVREACQVVRSAVDTGVDEPQRSSLYTALSAACAREARRRGAASSVLAPGI